MGGENKKTRQKLKNGLKKAGKIIATIAAIVIRPDKAAGVWLEKIFGDVEINNIHQNLENELLGKFIFLSPGNDPSTIIHGKVEKILWMKDDEGYLHVKDLYDDSTTSIPLNNLGLFQNFETQEKLEEYVKKKLEEKMLREGSLKLTFDGAYELGEITLSVLKELVYEGEEPLVFSPQFKEPISSIYTHFKNECKTKNPEKNLSIFYGEINEIGKDFPIESKVVYSIINHIDNMRRDAIRYEKDLMLRHKIEEPITVATPMIEASYRVMGKKKFSTIGIGIVISATIITLFVLYFLKLFP